jgi:hypothetical protein
MKNAIAILVSLAALFAGCSQNHDDEYHQLTQGMMEKAKIIDRVNRLFIATDNRDWPAARECFADSVLFDMTSLAGGEPARVSSHDIVNAWDAGLKALKSIHHHAGNYVVEINADESDVFCYGIAMHYLPNKTNQNVRTFVGSYDLHLVRQGNDWRIDRFKFTLKFIDGNAQLEKGL